jgi:hypothetical protein
MDRLRVHGTFGVGLIQQNGPWEVLGILHRSLALCHVLVHGFSSAGEVNCSLRNPDGSLCIIQSYWPGLPLRRSHQPGSSATAAHGRYAWHRAAEPSDAAGILMGMDHGSEGGSFWVAPQRTSRWVGAWGRLTGECDWTLDAGRWTCQLQSPSPFQRFFQRC